MNTRNPAPTLFDITGVVLAGGRARRMGGQDKGLVTLAGRPMVEHVLELLRPQVSTILINANRNSSHYAKYGYPVVADRDGDFSGPLAGMASAMAEAPTPFIVTVPCDGPLLAANLVSRLALAWARDQADIAVAHDGERMQPVYALLPVRLLPSLERWLAAGQHKIDGWYALHRVALADFSDSARMFINVNTLEDRDSVSAQLQDAADTPRTKPWH